MGLLFFPRGGSAYVVRYLSPALERAGWSVGLAVGSLGEPGEETAAPTFFAGLDVHFLDYPDTLLSPLGARGIGEFGIVGAAGAVANAVYNATGKRIRDLPITLDKLLA